MNKPRILLGAWITLSNQCIFIVLLIILSVICLGTFLDNFCLAHYIEGEIAFVACLDNNWDIFILLYKDTNSQIPSLFRVSETPFDEKQPAWSKEGEKLIYSTTDGKIHIIDVFSKKIRTLKIENPESKLASPSFSPDGRYVVLEQFKSKKIDDSDIVQYDLENDTISDLLSQVSSQQNPVWSPDGENIAYINIHCDMGCGHIIQEVWLMDSYGRYAKQLILTDSQCMQPSWSPDGNRIAFSSNIKGNFDIFIYNLNDNTLQQVTHHKSLDNNPTWSPDGKKIAFISTRSGIPSIWIKELETKELFKLSPFPDREIPCKDITWH